jgi:AcrR family transcriptional regulator
VILDAATKVFTKRGFAAARTEEIAEEAGINRALLHYYYRDKRTMFNLIFEARFKEFFQGVFSIIMSEDDLLNKIRRLIDHEITTLLTHPDLARFVITEIALQPEKLIQYGQKMQINPRAFIEAFEVQVQDAVESGAIKPISGRQLLMNTMSLCVYPFIAKPIIKTMMQMDENSFMGMMEERKQGVFQFIRSSLTP